MSEGEHTPGPWAYEASRDGRCFILYRRGAEIAAVDLPACEPILAILPPNNGLGTEEQLANAHLVAAAPQMLAALEAARPVLVDAHIWRTESHYPFPPDHERCACTPCVLQRQIAAAIAAAKGDAQ